MRGNTAPASTGFSVTHLLTFTNADAKRCYLYGNQRLVENFQARLDQDGLPSDITPLGGSLPLPVQSPVKEAVVSNENELLSTKEAAEILGITESLVRRYIRDGRLKSQRVGKTHAIRRTDLETFQRTGRRRHYTK